MKIGICAPGLIGGSLLKSLNKTKEYELYVYARNNNTVEAAKLYTPNASDDLNILKDCDVIFVCTPMNKIVEFLDKLEDVLNENTIVTDVSSLKEFVMKKRPYKFIGSHPMAGTELKGFENSYDSLFEGAKWILTPFDDTEEQDLEILKKVVEKTGAKSLVMDAKKHDRCAALISHMPMLVSQALMSAGMEEPDAMKMASSGFRDMTRLSMSNSEMASDMINMNRENILSALTLLNDTAESLLRADYTEKIEEIAAFRSNMYDSEGKNRL